MRKQQVHDELGRAREWFKYRDEGMEVLHLVDTTNKKWKIKRVDRSNGVLV